jgi:predicted MPP superfamily phosphohydrolase
LKDIVKSKPKKNQLIWIICAYSLLLAAAFFLLYIWPFNVRRLDNYKVHFLFNIILSIDFAIKLPLSLSFVSGLFLKKANRAIIHYAGFVIAIGFGGSVIYGSVFGKNELKINTVDIEFKNLPPSFDNFRILHISDLHLGSFMDSKGMLVKASEKSKALHPDIIFFTGDLVNNFANETGGWKETFGTLIKNRTCYSILGNHDYGNYSDWNDLNEKAANFERIVSTHNDFGMQILNNTNAKLKMKNDSIYIIGVENWGHPPFPQYADLENAMSGIPAEAFKILLSHDPAHWEEVIKRRNDISLTLSGHTHGLQWGISYAGIRFSLAYLARKNWSGLYKYNNSNLYVNAGLGMVAIPWRINMPGEITLIILKRSEID